MSAIWSVGLSNGDTIFEGKVGFEVIAGEVSPWQRLLNFLEMTGLEITSIQIKKHGNMYSLPSKVPKFGGEIPERYSYFRRAIVDINKENVVNTYHYMCVEAHYSDYVLQLWVDENRQSKGSWVTIVNK